MAAQTLLNFDRSQHPVPAKTSTIGMWIFLASLAMLFAGTMLAYIIIRITGNFAPGFGAIKLPWVLWVSTAVVLGASLTIHLALRAVQREKHGLFRAMMALTLLLGVAFCVIQLPALASLYSEHSDHLARKTAALDAAPLSSVIEAQRGEATERRFTTLYGLILVLIVVHALHVVGGIVQLGWVTLRAFGRAYDHEYHAPVKHTAMYWHFLDVVWLVMFGTMFAFG